MERSGRRPQGAFALPFLRKLGAALRPAATGWPRS